MGEFSFFFFVLVNEYMEDMVTFTTLLKIYSTKINISAMQRYRLVAGIGKISVQHKISAMQYEVLTYHVSVHCCHPPWVAMEIFYLDMTTDDIYIFYS